MLSVKLNEIKEILSKISAGVEKNNVNPTSSYIQIQNINGKLNLRVANNDYFLTSFINENITENIKATILADKFINIVSKLNKEFVELSSDDSSLILKTNSSKYVFPIIKKDGDTVEISEFNFDESKYTNTVFNVVNGSDLASIAESNAQGLVDATFTKEIQQFIFIDNLGALTFTDNIYINNFKSAYPNPFKILLNSTQARLLKIFDKTPIVNMVVYQTNNANNNIVVRLISDDVSLSLLTQPLSKVETFPYEKIRNLSVGENNHDIIINKSELDKALSRLMVFDKKFDKTILDYSKLIFGKSSVMLASVKNHNYEIIDYPAIDGINDDNKYEAIIRFGDLINQLKAVLTSNVNITFGNGKAIIINSNIKQVIPEIKARGK